MSIWVESVSFNYGNRESGAIPLVVSDENGKLVAITAPEWRKGQPDSKPAAVRLKTDDPDGGVSDVTPMIEVCFGSDNCSDFTTKIGAHLVDPSGQDLGVVYAQKVSFQSGLARSKFAIKIKTTKRRVAELGFKMQWYEKKYGGESRTLGPTDHTVFTVLKLPREPWHPFCDDISRQARLEALALAARWASGAETENMVADQITQGLYRFGIGRNMPVTYGGRSRFTEGTRLDLTRFLEELGEKGTRANCSDCAALVSSFANLLGCRMSQLRFESDRGKLRTKEVARIGERGDGVQHFNFHEVACNGNGTPEDLVWDACLGVGSSSGFQPLPGLPFGEPGEQNSYRKSIVDSKHEPCLELRPRLIREFGTVERLLRMMQPADKTRFGFYRWEDEARPRGARQRLDVGFSLARLNLADWLGAKRPVERRVESYHRPSLIEWQVEPAKTKWQVESTKYPPRLRIRYFECASWKQAHLALYELLSNLPEGDPQRRDVPAGELCFTVELDEALCFFTRGNMLFEISSEGDSVSMPVEFAKDLDSRLQAEPREDLVPEEFDEQSPAGFPIEDGDEPSWYIFVSDGSRLVIRSGQHPTQKEQVVTSGRPADDSGLRERVLVYRIE